ncbi:MAG: hypothetical protein JNN15_12840, partial [Blastocatellia bacterium]|nr:hypothetical protein [Blastocatellia bacterium]
NAAEKVDHGEQEEKKLPLRVLCATLSTLSMAVVYYFLSRTCNSLGTAQAAIHAKVYTLFLTTVYITGGLMTVTETKGYAFKFAHPDFSLYRRQNINRAIVIGSVMAIAYIIPSLLIWNYSIQAMHTNLFPVLLISLLLQPPTTLLWALLALLRSQGMFGRLLVIEIASMIIFVVAINIVPYTDLAWIVWLIFAGYFIIRIVLAWLLNFIGTVNTT